MLLCFIDFHNLWFLRQMSFGFSFTYFNGKGLPRLHPHRIPPASP